MIDRTALERENFLIETLRFLSRIRRSIHTIMLRIVTGLFHKITLLEVFKIKLDDAVLESGEWGPTPVTESVSQKHKITDNAIGYHFLIFPFIVPDLFHVSLHSSPVQLGSPRHFFVGSELLEQHGAVLIQ